MQKKGINTFSHSLSDAIYGLLFVFGVVSQVNNILSGDIGFRDLEGNLKISIILVSIMVFLIIARIYIVLHGFDEPESKSHKVLIKRNIYYQIGDRAFRVLILLSTLWMIKHFVSEKFVMDLAENFLSFFSFIFFIIKNIFINPPVPVELIFQFCKTVIVDHVIKSDEIGACKTFYYLKSEGAAIFFIAIFLIAWDISIVVIPAVFEKNFLAEVNYISNKRIPMKLFCYFRNKNLVLRLFSFLVFYLFSEKGAGRVWMLFLAFTLFYLNKFSIAYALPAVIILFFGYFNNAKSTTDIKISQYFGLLLSVIIYCIEPFGPKIRSGLEKCGIVKLRKVDAAAVGVLGDQG